MNKPSAPALIPQVPGPSRKRSRSPSSPFFPDAITFSDGKPAPKTLELNPEDVTARLEDLEVEIDTLHGDTEDKELLISKLQDSLAAAESKIAILQIRAADTESRHIESIKDWASPKTPTEIRQFLGLVGYYRRSKSMTKLTQKGIKFDWGEKEENAFQLIKQKLCSAPILALPEGSKDFVVYCDASHKGLGAVLMQREHGRM
ncbi:putative reverse transcriptase domain-containing protein [Tanacetum coccineum]